MKRLGGLFSEVSKFDSLYKAAVKARRGNTQNESAQRFFFFLEKELLSLKEELQVGTYTPGAYYFFTIKDPKERRIMVAPFRDRVVHHAVVSVLEPIYEKRFIADSYACRKGKGTHRAVFKAQELMKKYKWYLKTDILKCFDSIDHQILLQLISRKIKDKAFLQLLEKIIQNGGANGSGLPIGNLTSQFFANVYLHEVDLFIKNELGCRDYVRYMDDFVLFHEEKEQLKGWLSQIEFFLSTQLLLELKPSATYINQRQNGLRFLGTRVFPNTIRIHKDNLKRSLNRLSQREREWTKGIITEDTFSSASNSIIGHINSYNTHTLRKKLFEGYSR